MSRIVVKNSCRFVVLRVSAFAEARASGLAAAEIATAFSEIASSFATVMSVSEQCAPGTLNYRDFDPECDLWVPAETVPMEIRYALSNNIGLGGHNGAVIFKRYDGD